MTDTPSPPKSSCKGRIAGCKVTAALLVCRSLHVVGLLLRYGHFFCRGWEGAERSLLSGSLVTLQCQINANEETGSWLWLRTAGPQLQAVVIKEAAVSPCGVNKGKRLFCRPARYVWCNKHMITADITSIQGQGCTQDLVISSTLQYQSEPAPEAASPGFWARRGKEGGASSCSTKATRWWWTVFLLPESSIGGCVAMSMHKSPTKVSDDSACLLRGCISFHLLFS